MARKADKTQCNYAAGRTILHAIYNGECCREAKWTDGVNRYCTRHKRYAYEPEELQQFEQEAGHE